MQSRILVWVVGFLITLSLLRWTMNVFHSRIILISVILSLTFAVLVWALRAATPAAAISGAAICFLIVAATYGLDQSLIQSGLTPLAALFILTLVATRIGRSKKRKAGLAESQQGRSASQIVANLGFAGLIASVLLGDHFGGIGPRYWNHVGFDGYFLPMLIVAALSEATADTVSSEIGQAYGGTPIVLTTLRRAPVGTDGGLSLLGTAAGVFGAILVTLAAAWALHLRTEQTTASLVGGIAGLIFDSLLGATVEKKGWLGNDLVNFSSTIFAGFVACAYLLL
jgi:uncharacterized protein (TIGR00297 family)